MRRALATALITASVLAATASAAGVLYSPHRARIGGLVHAYAYGVDAGRYRLSLARGSGSQQNAVCARAIGFSTAHNGQVIVGGHIPRKLDCYFHGRGLTGSSGTIEVGPGVFRVVLCQAIAPTSCNGTKTYLKRGIRLHR